MGNVGALAANFHEGSRSEYLAQYVFSSFGTAFPVPHQEDTGVDLYCTLVERVGRLSWPRQHYTVQVKSDTTPWRLDSAESVRWLVKHPLPIFMCVLDKSTGRLRVWQTFCRFLLRALGGRLPASLELTPEDGKVGRSTQWKDGQHFSLSAPILDLRVNALERERERVRAQKVLEFWVSREAENLARISMGVPTYVMPDGYKTNTRKFTGWVFQSGRYSKQAFKPVRATLGEVLPWLAEGYRSTHNRQGMARTALLLRYLQHGARELGMMADAPFVQGDLNAALGVNSYLFAGVDQLAKKFDALLRARRSARPRVRKTKTAP
jgi:hypothetical protein